MSTSIRKTRTQERNAAVYDRFNELYNKQRLRYDDCMRKLCDEFYFTRKATVQLILKKEHERRELLQHQER